MQRLFLTDLLFYTREKMAKGGKEREPERNQGTEEEERTLEKKKSFPIFFKDTVERF